MLSVSARKRLCRPAQTDKSGFIVERFSVVREFVLVILHFSSPLTHHLVETLATGSLGNQHWASSMSTPIRRYSHVMFFSVTAAESAVKTPVCSSQHQIIGPGSKEIIKPLDISRGRPCERRLLHELCGSMSKSHQRRLKSQIKESRLLSLLPNLDSWLSIYLHYCWE